MVTKRTVAQEEPIAAIDEKTVTEVAESNGWDKDAVRELIAAGRLMVGLDGCCAVLPPPESPKSSTEVTQELRRRAQHEGRMAIIRAIHRVFVVGEGPMLGHVPNFSGSRLDALQYARESADRTGLPILEMGANAATDFDRPGIYVRAEIFDENARGETRCFRTYG